MLFLLLAAPSFADDAASILPGPVADARDDAAQKKGKKKDDDGKKGDKRKFMGWTWQPYVAPGGGVQIDASGTSAVAGVDVGILHHKGKATGDLYAGVDYTTGSNMTGYDFHVGESLGYKQKMWAAGAGLELLYNGYTSADGSFDLEPSAGVAVPVRLKVGPKKYYVKGGVTPAIYFAKKRGVENLGPIDELAWNLGAGLRYKGIRGEVGYEQTITRAGVISTPTVSLTWDGD